MKRKFIITAVATIEIPDDELPDDVSDSGEAIDNIKEVLEQETLTIDLGDYGEHDFTVTKVEDTEPSSL